MIAGTKLLLTVLRSIDALREHVAELPLSERNEMADLVIDHLIEVLRAQRPGSRRAHEAPPEGLPRMRKRQGRPSRFGRRFEGIPEGYVQLRQLLRDTGLGDMTVWPALKRGVIPSGKVGKLRYVEKEAWDAWLRERKGTNGAAHA